jgi:AAA15 family ATPase/GTPase
MKNMIFKIKNFRNFKNLEEFEFRPITILTGPNSSGKSSLMKAFLLLLKTWSKDPLGKLDLADTDLNLGSFNNVINRSSKDESIEFQINNVTLLYRQYENIPQFAYLYKLKVNDKSGKVLVAIDTEVWPNIHLYFDSLSKDALNNDETRETIAREKKKLIDYCKN